MKISAASRTRSRVLTELLPGRSYSRTELARKTGLSAPTVSRVTRQLLKGAVLRERRADRPRGKGPSQRLEVNGARGSILGISLLPPLARVLVLDLQGAVLKEVREPVSWNHGRAGLLDPLKRAVRRSLKEWPAGRPRAIGAGLALPGRWDKERGVSLAYPRVRAWKDVPIRAMIEEWTRCPAVLIGYGPALAAAEQSRRPLPEPRHLISVEAADNIAMGAVANGALVEGASGNAGELGHIQVGAAGPVCYCGNAGCLEALATCSSVVEEMKQSDAAPSPITYESVVGLAREGDLFCARTLGRAARALGAGLAVVLNLFNPEVLVLNGRFFEAGDLVMAPLLASLHERALSSKTAPLTIERSTLGGPAAALGAGIAAIRSALHRL